jgi:hypothetical protein
VQLVDDADVAVGDVARQQAQDVLGDSFQMFFEPLDMWRGLLYNTRYS